LPLESDEWNKIGIAASYPSAPIWAGRLMGSQESELGGKCYETTKAIKTCYAKYWNGEIRGRSQSLGFLRL